MTQVPINPTIDPKKEPAAPERLVEVVEGTPKRTESQTQVLEGIESIPGHLADGAISLFNTAKDVTSSAVDVLVGRDSADEPDEETQSMIEEIERLNQNPISDPSRDAMVAEIEALNQIDSINKAEPEEKDIIDRGLERMFGTDVPNDPIPFSRAMLTVGGGFVGGIAGAEIAAPFGPVGVATGFGLGSIAGAVVGTVAPERIQDFVDYSGLSIFKDFNSENFPLLAPDDLEIVLTGEAILEAATGGALAVARFTTRGLTRGILGVGEEETAIAKRAKERGVDLFPIQLSTRKIPRGFIVVFGKFPLLSAPLAKQGAKTDSQFASALQGLPIILAPVQRTADELGVKMFREAKSLAKSLANDFNRRYDEVFAMAKAAKVIVLPKQLTSQGSRIIHRLIAETPRVLDKKTGKLVAGKISAEKQGVIDYIKAHILPMKNVPQSLVQMDAALKDMSAFISGLEPAQQKFASKLMLSLRQNGIKDMMKNMRGKNAGAITQRLKAIDNDYSVTMTDILETSTAKNFATFTRKGLRASVGDPVTRTPIDTLADKILHLRSPQNINDIYKLVGAKTYAEISAKVIRQGVESAMTDLGFTVGSRFDVRKFSAHFGLGDPLGGKYQTVKKMLERNKGGLKITDLEKLAEAGKVIEGLDIPSAASFVLRRTLLGGVHSFLGSIVPGAVAGGVAGNRKIFTLHNLMAAGMFLFGGRGFISAVSNPLTSQLLRDVMSEEVSDLVRREAWVKFMRLSTELTFGDPDPVTDAAFRLLPDSTKVKTQMQGAVEVIIGSLDAQIDQ